MFVKHVWATNFLSVGISSTSRQNLEPLVSRGIWNSDGLSFPQVLFLSFSKMLVKIFGLYFSVCCRPFLKGGVCAYFRLRDSDLIVIVGHGG